MRWVLDALGLTNPSGLPYLWWSGFGADLPIFVGTVVFVRHHKCHERRCWRIGKHPIEGAPYVVCRRHHPHID